MLSAPVGSERVDRATMSVATLSAGAGAAHTLSSNTLSSNTLSSTTLSSQPHDGLTTSRCCCSGHGGGNITVVSATDIPAHVTAGPYPGGLGFGSRVTDHDTADTIVKVSGGYISILITSLTGEMHAAIVLCASRPLSRRQHLEKKNTPKNKKKRWKHKIEHKHTFMNNLPIFLTASNGKWLLFCVHHSRELNYSRELYYSLFIQRPGTITWLLM